MNLNVIEPSFEPFVWFVRNSWRKIQSVIRIICEVDLLGPLSLCNVHYAKYFKTGIDDFPEF